MILLKIFGIILVIALALAIFQILWIIIPIAMLVLYFKNGKKKYPKKKIIGVGAICFVSLLVFASSPSSSESKIPSVPAESMSVSSSQSEMDVRSSQEPELSSDPSQSSIVEESSVISSPSSIMELQESVDISSQSSIIESQEFLDASSQQTTTESQNQASVSSQSVAPQTQSRQVYYTKSGKKYHYQNPCGSGTYYPCTLNEALSRGLGPCSKCVG